MVRIASTSNISNPKRYGYDIRLDNIFLRTAISPDRQMTIESSDVQAGQQVNVKQNPEDFTSNLGRIYSRNNFSAGQGLDTAHRANGKPDDVNRFWDSKGVDVFHGDEDTSYNIHLLHTTSSESLSFTDSNNYMTQTTDKNIWITDGTTIHKYDSSTETWSTITSSTNNATHDFTGIVAFGNELYLTTADGTSGSQLIKYNGSTWSVLNTSQSSSGGLTGIWFAKNTLFISGNDGTAEYIWDINPFDSWSSSNLDDDDSIIEVEPTHQITGVIDGGAVVLAASTDGNIYSFKLSGTAFVNQGQTKIPFEEIHSISAAEGIIFFGTKEFSRDVGRLYRAELVAADDLYVLANRQLIKEWVVDNIDTTPHAMFVSRDSVYMGVKEATNEVNLWRYYLPTGGLARDLQTSGNGYVSGITQFNGKFIIVVEGSDVYKETSTYELEGYLILSAADYYTAEQKQFVGAEVSAEVLENDTSIELHTSTKFESLNTPTSSDFKLNINLIAGVGDVEQPLSSISRYIVPKIVLKTEDGVNTPKLKSIQIRALARPELVVAQIPINISDRVERPGRRPVLVKGLGDKIYSVIKQLEGTNVIAEIFDTHEIIQGVLEKVTYPILSSENIGSTFTYAIITIRGTRQPTPEPVTSRHVLGVESIGLLRFGPTNLGA